jgi:hypothetical protein
MRYLFPAGESASPDPLIWAQKALGVPGFDPLVAERDRPGDRGKSDAHGMMPVTLGSPMASMASHSVDGADGAADPCQPGKRARS